MKSLLSKVNLALRALTVVGLSIAASTNMAEGASLQAIAGLDTVFNSCYASYARSFNDVRRVGGGASTNSDLVRAFLNSDRQIQDKSILGSYVSIGKAFSFDHPGQVVDELKISYDASAAFLFSASQMQELDYMSANSTQSLLLGKSSEKQRCG